jgi:hypothetical protein
LIDVDGYEGNDLYIWHNDEYPECNYDHRRYKSKYLMCYRFDGLHSHNDKYHKQIEPSNYFEGSTSIIDHISHGETDNGEGAEENYEYNFDGLYLWVGQIDMCVDIEDGDYGEL